MNDMKNDRSERTVLTNMCMVEDGDSILVLDKVGGGYTGITFPGGHIEAGESFRDSVVREVLEETGLLIEDPVLAGTYQWYEDGVRNLLLLYRAEKYTGELRDSDEGRVFWTGRKDFMTMDLAEGMADVMDIMEGRHCECVDLHEDGRYRGVLY